MRKGNSPTSQKELVNKLETIRVLANECLTLLSQRQHLAYPRPRRTEQPPSSVPSLDFESHVRAFVKRHARGLSGPKKFVLILAYLTKGSTNKEVSLGDIKKLWNTMKSKSLLGMRFNLFFSDKAKEGGWVGSKKRGFYNLDRSWKKIFADD
ncbi:MAG TPA: hypothetical protein VI913_04215 [Candidatus Peribacteraceae bacterium]|nr:hypothetical protein [Candidatus Peribacteraceae bacterium]